jgi:hypothetical protein
MTHFRSSTGFTCVTKSTGPDLAALISSLLSTFSPIGFVSESGGVVHDAMMATLSRLERRRMFMAL